MEESVFKYNKIIHLDDGVEIVLSTKKWGDLSIFIDAEDLDKVLSQGWYIRKPRHIFYCYSVGKGEKLYSLHRFILNFPNHRIIDHKDGNGLNNRKSNLRLATPSQNGANSSPSSKKKVNWKGVSYLQKKKLYLVQAGKDGVVKNFGLFKNPLLAAARYNEIAIEYHGEFARLNEFTEEQKQIIANPPLEHTRIGNNNVTGFKGVSLNRKGRGLKKYISTIFHNGKNIHLGYFKDLEQAKITYLKAKEIYHNGDLT